MWAHNGLGKGKILLQINVQDPSPDVLQLLGIVSLFKITDLTAELAGKKIYEDSPSTPMNSGRA